MISLVCQPLESGVSDYYPELSISFLGSEPHTSPPGRRIRSGHCFLTPVGIKNSTDVLAHRAGLQCCNLPLGVITQHTS